MKNNAEKALIIVESPNKVKTIKSFLDKSYDVIASVGHIRKINDSGLYNCGIDVKNAFAADYVIDDSKKDLIKEMKGKVKNAGLVYLCTDPDRPRRRINFMAFKRGFKYSS